MFVEGVELVLHVEGEVGFFEGELAGEFLIYFFVGFALEVSLELVVGTEVVFDAGHFLRGIVFFGLRTGFQFGI